MYCESVTWKAWLLDLFGEPLAGTSDGRSILPPSMLRSRWMRVSFVLRDMIAVRWGGSGEDASGAMVFKIGILKMLEIEEAPQVALTKLMNGLSYHEVGRNRLIYSPLGYQYQC